ncbi:LuxR C-terminal-related transcriptional regulator [Streptomyces sp. NPDC008086]|uniref:LuxR C-terminal-related transcriptional regulator n=1 Tax=Streptomyces sp. NPDC008086 TaxID=3364807 RepID=UPI0036ED7397
MHGQNDHQTAPANVTSLSIALFSRHGIAPTPLARLRVRPVREPGDMCPSDDILLLHGIGMAQELKRFAAETEGPLPPTAVLAPWLDWDDVSLALDLGAVSYLLENRYSCLLAEALVCTSRGASCLDPAIAAEQHRLASRARTGRTRDETDAASVAVAGRRPQLSPRERQVMDLLASGRRVGEVARELFLTDKTVRNYLSRIYRKLDVRSQSEAILRWLGYIEPTAPGHL